MSKNILFAGLAYYPNVGAGGPVRVMRSYGSALTSLGHNVTIYCANIAYPQFHKMTESTIEAGMHGMRVVYLNTNLRLSHGLTISFDLLRFLNREMKSFDVVHLFGPRDFFTTMAAIYARKYGVPYIIHTVGSLNYNNSKVLLKTLWDAVIGRRIIYGAKYVVESNEEQVKYLLSYGIPFGKTAVISWSPDSDLVECQTQRGSFRDKYGIPPEAKVILFLGRVSKKKRLDLVIQALAILNNPDYFLVVVGHDDDGSMEILKKSARELMLDNRVIWVGPIHSPESAAVYHDSDVFVLVSDNESVPMALLEACSLGVPVIISDHTGMSELIKNKAGFVVETTPKAVALGLKNLFQNPSLRQKFADGGKRMVAQHFSQDALGAKLVNLY